MSPASTTWVAFLRGINLGRAKRVAMSDLRALLEGLGFADVRTLLQSGNAVFTAGKGSESSIARRIESQLAAELGVESKLILRSAPELAAVVGANPFVRAGVDGRQLHAVFLSAKPPAARVRSLEPEQFAPDEVAFGDRVVYLRLPKGVAGSRIPNWDKSLKLHATMRTWNTVTRVAEMAADTDRAAKTSTSSKP